MRRARRRRGEQSPERGAAAVEFALVAIILVSLVFGIAEFGRMWLLQSSLSAAARDAARTMAITNVPSDAEEAARRVFTAGDQLEDDDIDIDASECDAEAGGSVAVRLTYDAAFLTGFFDPLVDDGSITLRGEGVMRCGG